MGSSFISCGGAEGFRTRSRMGPIRRRRKASRNPTAAIRMTEASTCHQYGAAYRKRRVNSRIDLPDEGDPGLRAPGRAHRYRGVGANWHFTGNRAKTADGGGGEGWALSSSTWA